MSAEASFLRKMSTLSVAVMNSNRLSLKMPRQVFENEEDFNRVVEDIRNQIDSVGLPDFISENPFYRFAVVDTLTEEVIRKKKNILPFIPKKLDRISIEGNIREIGQKIIDMVTGGQEFSGLEVELTKKAIRNTLLLNLGKSLDLIDATPIIRKDILHPGKEGLLSTSEIRTAVLKIKTQIENEEILKDDADIALLKELGIADGTEDMEKIKNDLRTCIRKAWKLYEELGESLAKAQAEFGIGGEQILIDPSLFTKGKGLYDLLIQSIGNEDAPIAETGPALLPYHEAQTAAYLAFLFFQVSNHPAFIASRKLQEKYRIAVGTKLFGEEEKLVPEKVFYDTYRNIIKKPKQEGEDDIYKIFQTRHLQIAGDSDSPTPQREYKVWFDDIRTKREDSIIKRLITSPDFNYEDIPDIIAGRLVLWDYNRSDLLVGENDDPTIEAEKNTRRADLEAISKKIGKALGLTLSFGGKENLKAGYFYIIDKLEGNEGNGKSHEMYAYKFYGVNKEGVRIEFQILPKDVFESINSWQSPNNHDFYDMEKAFLVAKSIYRQSSSPRIHEVARMAKERLKERKDRRQGMRMERIS